LQRYFSPGRIKSGSSPDQITHKSYLIPLEIGQNKQNSDVKAVPMLLGLKEEHQDLARVAASEVGRNTMSPCP
jgi:hypothetical protein